MFLKPFVVFIKIRKLSLMFNKLLLLSLFVGLGLVQIQGAVAVGIKHDSPVPALIPKGLGLSLRSVRFSMAVEIPPPSCAPATGTIQMPNAKTRNNLFMVLPSLSNLAACFVRLVISIPLNTVFVQKFRRNFTDCLVCGKLAPGRGRPISDARQKSPRPPPKARLALDGPPRDAACFLPKDAARVQEAL